MFLTVLSVFKKVAVARGTSSADEKALAI